MNHLENLKQIPKDIFNKLENPPNTPIESLELAKSLSDSLSIEHQLWLINRWQNHIWMKNNDLIALRKLEKLRSLLLSFVQSRLAWEITLLELFVDS